MVVNGYCSMVGKGDCSMVIKWDYNIVLRETTAWLMGLQHGC